MVYRCFYGRVVASRGSELILMLDSLSLPEEFAAKSTP
ncbi:hypothetical protein FRUB_02416 [Fimbriiglobus ruber]|uniref:Uncharacterized protein n=1 Tax=Fimbriiglobus ruber TaxID=1908690 RepID=A0A225DY32_9BACT|nr:hypothetical protein FRUB_02416 [Fimbriiglobus ruber]